MDGYSLFLVILDQQKGLLKLNQTFYKTIMGRPSTKPKDLRDGYYIEVRNKNQRTGIKIRRDTKKQLLLAIDEYKTSKEVTVLGKSENGKMRDIPNLN